MRARRMISGQESFGGVCCMGRPEKEKEGRQGCSRNPRHGAQQNSTRRRPILGRAKAASAGYKDPKAQGCGFP
jgi:hypothetical protein